MRVEMNAVGDINHMQAAAQQIKQLLSSPISEFHRLQLEQTLQEIEQDISALTSQPSATSHQVGGDHYRDLAVQPIDYIHRNGLGFIEGSVVKYVTRWRKKNGVEDLRKARHFLDLLIEMETKEATP